MLPFIYFSTYTITLFTTFHPPCCRPSLTDPASVPPRCTWHSTTGPTTECSTCPPAPASHPSTAPTPRTGQAPGPAPRQPEAHHPNHTRTRTWEGGRQKCKCIFHFFWRGFPHLLHFVFAFLAFFGAIWGFIPHFDGFLNLFVKK